MAFTKFICFNKGVEPIPFGLSNKMSSKNLSNINNIPKKLSLKIESTKYI